MKFTTRFITTLAVLGIISTASIAPAAGYLKLGDIKGEAHATEAQMEYEYFRMIEEAEEAGFPTDVDSGNDDGWGISGGLDRDIIRRIPRDPPKEK